MFTVTLSLQLFSAFKRYKRRKLKVKVVAAVLIIGFGSLIHYQLYWYWSHTIFETLPKQIRWSLCLLEKAMLVLYEKDTSNLLIQNTSSHPSLYVDFLKPAWVLRDSLALSFYYLMKMDLICKIITSKFALFPILHF